MSVITIPVPLAKRDSHVYGVVNRQAVVLPATLTSSLMAICERETVFTCPYTIMFRTCPLTGTASGNLCVERSI